MSSGKKIYFLSDFHLGVPTTEKSLAREKQIIRFWFGFVSLSKQVN